VCVHRRYCLYRVALWVSGGLGGGRGEGSVLRRVGGACGE
jgi:hypothetical protein